MIPKDILLRLTNSPTAPIHYCTFRYFSNTFMPHIHINVKHCLLYFVVTVVIIMVVALSFVGWVCSFCMSPFAVRFSCVRALCPVIWAMLFLYASSRIVWFSSLHVFLWCVRVSLYMSGSWCTVTLVGFHSVHFSLVGFGSIKYIYLCVSTL